ncbi:MAG: hypothetical protein K2H85_05940, partial [Allobaculum sp.]|nr:hypothetical protein [Allobaculum sp.]
MCLLMCFGSISAIRRNFEEFVSVNGTGGIPLSGITALTVDDNGFVWGASRMGIIRATPSAVGMYRLPVSTSDVMQMKVVYNKGELVAATQNGKVFRFDQIKDRFEHLFSVSDTLGNTDCISNLVIDSSGIPWISTSLGIFYYSDNALHQFSHDMSGYCYILQSAGDDMFAISDGKMYSISDNGRKYSLLPGTFDSYVSNATYDKFRDRILLGTYQGELWEYSLKEKKLTRLGEGLIPEVIIRSILVHDPDSMLIGLEGSGIIMLDSDGGKVLEVIQNDIDNPSSLKGNSVFAMVTDRQGRLWTATTSAGLQYSDADGDDAGRIVHKYNSSSSLCNNEINYLLTDKDGNLWVATNDGISRRTASDGSWLHLFGRQQLSVLSLTQGHDGLIYASTYGKGIYVLDPSPGREKAH